MLVSLNQAYKQFGGKVIFSDLSLNINYGDKIGLVGINGSGKSTLVKAIAGILDLDGGEIIRKKGLRIGYVEQLQSIDRSVSVFDFVYQGNEKVIELEKKIKEAEEGKVADTKVLTGIFEEYEKIDGYRYKAKVEEVLQGIGIYHLKDRFVNEISGGELRRVFLARVLVSDSDLFLFDEPTNHLDLFAVKWFESFLRNCKNAFVLVSHDQYLLDNAVSKIIEINAGKVFVFNGNYKFYQKKRRELAENAEKEYRRKVEEIEREMEFVRRNIAGQKTKQAKSRLKKIEKIEIGERNLFKDIKINLNFKESKKKSKYILECKDLIVGYNRPLIKGINLLVQRGEKYGIVGRNGSGKSTFLKTIAGKISPLEGEVKVFPGIKVAYFDQNVEFEDENKTVLQTLWDADPFLNRDEVLNYLAYFYFREEMVESRVKFLSGGERSRLKLACLMRGEYDLLILDEPTNHLDILLTDAITFAVKNFKGSVLAVSHHRHFLDSIADRVIELRDGNFRLFLGNLSYYFDKVKEEEEKQTQIEAEKKKNEKKEVSKKKNGISKNELLRAKWRLEEVEKEIETLEKDKEEIENLLNQENVLNDYLKVKELSEKLNRLDKKLEELLSEWQRLGEICM
ncbi:ABC transport system ATP-binding protein [Thermotomaculum hydrothermale]|uniref:ABC transport system ATP-binding protein n=1 Tax=Thermotomaculum hydrothermale TaxID=981385 RepID=A0A7R6PMS1_9BACT|nr:ABC-F family ATP-binding cassette domain-containing protein [Thermotomaculum hydrothermale]BBB32438.1 ABC transport system ATP-binding protein [Thermotomaculum hydrothermale]